MKINTKIRYGLRIMIEIANHHPHGILQKQIAESQGLTLPYIDIIITGLRNAGLIVNFSGKSSGYILTRPAGEITVYDIYRAFEPELALVHCINLQIECERSEICSTNDYWFELNNQLKHLLRNKVLGEFASQVG